MATPFQERCWELLESIPRGKVTTYREIGRALDTRAYQAIGQAMGANPRLIEVPCHRVVASDGRLSGYALGVDKKRKLLISEGVEVNQDYVDLDRYLFQFASRDSSESTEYPLS